MIASRRSSALLCGLVALTALGLAGCSSSSPSHSAAAKHFSAGKSESAADPTPTPMITAGADGQCNDLEASWSPLLSRAGIQVVTYVSGHVIVTVTTAAGSTPKPFVVPTDALPYSIEIPGPSPASVTAVQLTSTDEPTSTCVVVREPGS